MSEKRRKYDQEFREGAVRIVRETRKPIAQVARDLGINEGTLGHWFAKDRGEREGTSGLSVEDIADQRTFYRVPYAVCCVILGVSQSWFYKWFNRPATAGQRRRADLDAAVLKMFNTSTRTYGSPRIHADLLEAGWMLSVNTVADSMRRQGLQGRKPKHSQGLTRQDRKAPKFPDLLKRDFTAPAANVKWCGDITEIPTDEGKLYMATVLDLSLIH